MNNNIDWKSYLLTIFKIALICSALFFIFNLVRNSPLGHRLLQVKTEIWLTAVISGLAAIWKFYTDKENNKIAIFNNKANANAKIIKELDNRVDSVLVQIQELYSTQLDDTSKIDELTKLVNEHRQQLLKERLELVTEFYKELLEIRQQINNKNDSKT